MKPNHIYTKYIRFGLIGFYGISTFVGCLVGFYGISTIVGYLMPNPLYNYISNKYDLVELGFKAYHLLQAI